MNLREANTTFLADRREFYFNSLYFLDYSSVSKSSKRFFIKYWPFPRKANHSIASPSNIVTKVRLHFRRPHVSQTAAGN